MRVAIGCDHAGFPLKGPSMEEIRSLGHEVVDLGTDGTSAVDYPDYAQAVAEMLMRGEADRGVIVCGSGVGASVVANKVPGVRAATCHDSYSAHQGVEHDDMNVLTLGARVIGPSLAKEVIRSFLSATFSNDDRHVRRLKKLKAVEARYQRPDS